MTTEKHEHPATFDWETLIPAIFVGLSAFLGRNPRLSLELAGPIRVSELELSTALHKQVNAEGSLEGIHLVLFDGRDADATFLLTCVFQSCGCAIWGLGQDTDAAEAMAKELQMVIDMAYTTAPVLDALVGPELPIAAEAN